mmetsp:Transcript_44584/g.48239  ORF Transcript_44584/g.48239 Transcript_44584/m.48239 type:complete len:288 (-) Transcript_44584:356-1219(-)
MIYLYPDLFKQVIAMDVAMMFGVNGTAYVNEPYGDEMITSLFEYQQNNINAFLTDDDDLMMYNINTTLGDTSPCADCRIAPNASGVGARTGWPYYNFVRTDPTWTSDGFDDTPLDEWEFSWMPSYPNDIPLLYLYVTEAFQSPLFFEWINTHGDNDGRSEYMKIDDSDHWMAIRQPTVVNNKIAEWIAAASSTSNEASSDVSLSTNGSATNDTDPTTDSTTGITSDNNDTTTDQTTSPSVPVIAEVPKEGVVSSSGSGSSSTAVLGSVSSKILLFVSMIIVISSYIQ